jgi:hypothetical protein
MKPLVKLSLVFVACFILVMSSIVSMQNGMASTTPTIGPVSDQPPDRTPYRRKAIPEDYIALPLLSPRIRVRDVVVSNTDPNLTNTEGFNDSEPSIAIDPTTPDQIVITTFADPWVLNPPSNAALWYSGDGGITWTKKLAIPPPRTLEKRQVALVIRR